MRLMGFEVRSQHKPVIHRFLCDLADIGFTALRIEQKCGLKNVVKDHGGKVRGILRMNKNLNFTT